MIFLNSKFETKNFETFALDFNIVVHQKRKTRWIPEPWAGTLSALMADERSPLRDSVTLAHTDSTTQCSLLLGIHCTLRIRATRRIGRTHHNRLVVCVVYRRAMRGPRQLPNGSASRRLLAARRSFPVPNAPLLWALLVKAIRWDAVNERG